MSIIHFALILYSFFQSLHHFTAVHRLHIGRGHPYHRWPCRPQKAATSSPHGRSASGRGAELTLGDSTFPGAAPFGLKAAVYSHGLLMMALNRWDPVSSALLRPPSATPPITPPPSPFASPATPRAPLTRSSAWSSCAQRPLPNCLGKKFDLGVNL